MASPAVTQGSGAPLVTITTTTEIAALVSTAFAFNAPTAQGLLISTSVTGATGASTTSMQVRLYRGATISGTLLATWQESAGASSFYSNGGQVLDTAPVSGGQYTLSVQQVGATGNGTVTFANISIEPANLSGA